MDQSLGTSQGPLQSKREYLGIFEGSARHAYGSDNFIPHLGETYGGAVSMFRPSRSCDI